MDSRWLWGIVLVIIVVAGGWYVFGRGGSEGAPTEEMTEGSQAAGEVAAPGANMPLAPVMVSYTDQGFSPASVTVAQNQSVTWTNNSSEDMWVASNPHPTHEGYDGTTRDTHCAPGYAGPAPLDECTSVPAGGTFTFAFTQAGSWGYHNHADHSMTGTVVVTAASTTSSDTGATASTSVNVQVQ